MLIYKARHKLGELWKVERWRETGLGLQSMEEPHIGSACHISPTNRRWPRSGISWSQPCQRSYSQVSSFFPQSIPSPEQPGGTTRWPPAKLAPLSEWSPTDNNWKGKVLSFPIRARKSLSPFSSIRGPSLRNSFHPFRLHRQRTVKAPMALDKWRRKKTQQRSGKFSLKPLPTDVDQKLCTKQGDCLLKWNI